ncbi:MAG: ABC transporter permease [Planctomycetota bacterium]
MAAIARREFASQFRTPTGWIVAAAYAALTAGVFTLTTLLPGEPATLRYFFGPSTLLLLVVGPALSMRLFSEEFRSGSFALLRAAPVGEASMVIGKYTGAALFLVVMLAVTLPFPASLFLLADPTPDAGAFAAGYLGLALAGLACLAFGTFVSTLTESQTLAFLATMLVVLGAFLATGLAAQRLPVWIGEPLAALSIAARVAGFARGVIDTGDVCFFIAIIAASLAAACGSLRRRRTG